MDDKLIEKYVWVSKGESCSACESLDEQEFKTIDEIPDRPHPNCDCFIREVEGELCDYCPAQLDKIDEMIGDAKSLQDEVEAEKSDIERIESEYSGIDSDDVVRVLMDLHSLLNPLGTLAVTIGVFASNYQTLRNAEGDWQDGTDKYYHLKANCQAAQQGFLGEAVAKGLSDFKELIDYYDNLYVKKKSLEEALKDSAEDQEANREGRELGRKYPTGSCGDLGKHRRPKDLPKERW